MKEHVKKERFFTLAFAGIMLASMLVSFGNYFFYSTMPIYAKELGSPAAMVGFVTGTYTIACLITRFFAGGFCVKFGRFIIMIVGAVLCILGTLLYLLSGEIFLLLAGRAIHGIGFALFTTASGTAIVDIIPKSRRMEGLGLFSLYSTFSSAFGPGIALSMIENESLGFPVLFITASAIMGLVLLISFCLKKPIQNAYKEDSATEKKPGGAFAPDIRMLAPASIMVILCFSQSSIISYLALFAGQHELGNIGAFFTIASAAIFASRFFAGKIGDKFGISYVLVPCILMAAAALGGISLFPSRTVIFIAAIPYGLGFGVAGPIINTLIVNSCDDSQRSTATSLYYASLDIGIGLGSIILGAVSALLGYGMIILASAGLVLVSLIVYFLVVPKTVRKGL